jgi:hypothetical protein
MVGIRMFVDEELDRLSYITDLDDRTASQWMVGSPALAAPHGVGRAPAVAL